MCNRSNNWKWWCIGSCGRFNWKQDTNSSGFEVFVHLSIKFFFVSAISLQSIESRMKKRMNWEKWHHTVTAHSCALKRRRAHTHCILSVRMIWTIWESFNMTFLFIMQWSLIKMVMMVTWSGALMKVWRIGWYLVFDHRLSTVLLFFFFLSLHPLFFFRVLPLSFFFSRVIILWVQWEFLLQKSHFWVSVSEQTVNILTTQSPKRKVVNNHDMATRQGELIEGWKRGKKREGFDSWMVWWVSCGVSSTDVNVCTSMHPSYMSDSHICFTTKRVVFFHFLWKQNWSTIEKIELSLRLSLKKSISCFYNIFCLLGT